MPDAFGFRLPHPVPSFPHGAAALRLKTEIAHGFVLRVRPLTDTSLIVHWLTADSGRIATVAKGARQGKSAFAGKLDLAFECDFSFQRARRGELHLLREVTLTDPRPVLRTRYEYLTQTAYAVRLIELTTETDTPVPEVYGLMAGFLTHLIRQPPQPRNIYALELKLLAGQGLEPDLSETALGTGARQLVDQLTYLEWPEIARLQATGGDVRAVRQFLQVFLMHHCGKLPAGRAQALGAAA